MGWADCGEDDLGRPIGYAYPATCDAPGCSAEIHRGLSYVCGGTHGGDGVGCGRYFCEAHATVGEIYDKRCVRLCQPCYDMLDAEGCVDVEEAVA